MSWQTAYLKRRRLPWHKVALIWMISGALGLAEPFMTPYYLWRMAEDIRRAKQLSVPPRTFTVRTKRPAR